MADHDALTFGVFCTQCGGAALAGAQFCGKCGAPLLPSTTPDGFSQHGARANRPLGVWAISAWYVLSAIWTVFSFGLILTGAIPVTAAQRTYFGSWGPLTVISSVGMTLVSMAAAVTFFLLKEVSVRLFGLSLLCGLAFQVIHAVTTNYFEALPPGAGVGVVIGLALQFAVFRYAASLRDKHVLK